MRTMKHLVSSAVAKIAALTLGCAVLCASTVLAAGFDGKSLTTNDWFDVGFSGVAADTKIAANSTTGITRGAGSWTAAPTSGEAVVLSDGTLSIDADSGEALTLTPAASPATGMETVAVKVKANVSTSLEDITPTDSPIAAFAIYTDDTVVKPAAYVSGGWTNLVYANMVDLTNGWFTLYIDYADVGNVKSVRFSVQPDGGSVTVLADSNGTTWFTSASSATKISSLSFCGSGLCQTISGDTHQTAVAQVNGVNFATFADAITAAGDTYDILVLDNTATVPAGWKIADNKLVPVVYVAQIVGGDTYTTLQAAVDAAYEMTGDVTISLLADTTEKVVVKQKQGLNLTIDGNNKARTITGQLIVYGMGHGVERTDTLTISGIAFTGTTADVYGGTLNGFVTCPNDSQLGTTGGTIANYDGIYDYAHHVTITNCSFSGVENERNAVAVRSFARGLDEIVLVDLTSRNTHSLAQFFDVTNAVVAGCDVAQTKSGINFNVARAGAVVVSDTTITGETTGTAYGIRLQGLGYSTLRLLDGVSVTAANALWAGNTSQTAPSYEGKIIVEGGKYAGVLLQDMPSYTYEITDGYFSESPNASFIAEGYEAVANTDPETSAAYPYTIGLAAVPVAQIVNGTTTNEYTTLAAAITAAQGGDTIELLKDVVWDGTGSYCQLNASGSVTIDGKGFTLSAPVTGGPTDSAIMLGDSGSSGSASVYTVTNMTFSGFTTISHSVLRAQGVRATIVDCTFTGNGSTGGEWAVVTANNGADVTVKDCVFSGNTGTKCVDVGFNVATGSSLAVDNCLFENNNLTGHGVIYVAGDITAASVHNSTFSGNTVLSPEPTPDDAKPNAAVVYCSGVTSITGCLFTNNTVKAYGKEGVVVLGSGAQGAAVTGNAFVDNELSTDRSPAHYATLYVSKTCVLSANYWGDGAAPAEADQQDIYNSGTQTPTIDTYATNYTVVGNGVTVTLYVPPVAAVITDNGATTNTYETFAEAISAARANGGTVALLADIDVAGGTSLGYNMSDIVLDGQGYTISCASGVLFSGTNVVVSNLKVEMGASGNHIMTVTSGTFTGCEFVGASGVKSVDYADDKSGVAKTLTFSYCTFRDFTTDNAVLNDDESNANSQLVVDHCTFSNTVRVAILQRADTFTNNTVTDFAKFTANNTGVVMTGNTFDKGTRNGVMKMYQKPAEISGNDFSAAGVFENNNTSTMTEADPLNLVDNIWGDYDKSTLPVGIIAELPSYIAQIIRNNAVFAQYETLQAAVNAAQSGDTIELLMDIQLFGTEQVAINKVGNFVIDGKGYAISPAADSAYIYERFKFGMDGEESNFTKNYTVTNLTITGFTDSTYFIRNEGCSVTFVDCTITNNNLSAQSNSRLVLATASNLTMKDCVVADNATASYLVDFNTNGSANETVGTLDVDGCLFDGNTVGGTGLVYTYGSSSGGDAIKNSTFSGNTVNSAAAAIVYFSGATDVTGCFFTNNTVTASDATQKCGVLALGSGAAGSDYTGNAFVNNELTAAAGGAYGTIYAGAKNVDLTANYWGSGNAPTTGNGADLYLAKDEGVVYDSFAYSYTLNEDNYGVTVVLGKMVTFELDGTAPAGATAPSGGAYAVDSALPPATCTDADKSFAGWKVKGSDPAVIVAVVPADAASPIALVATWIGTKTVTVTESETTVSINVTDDWISDNVEKAGETATTAEIQAALEKEDKNGLPAWQNYVLGQDPNASVAADAAQGAVDAMPVVSTVTPQTVDTGFKVEYRVDEVNADGTPKTGGEGALQDTPALTVDLTELTPENNVAYYKTVAVITSTDPNKDVTVTVESTNTIGVLKVESGAKSTVIAVPWEALSDDGGIKVADLVRTATLSEGDELKVYDPNTGTYKVWTLNSSKEWEPNTTVTESGSSLAPSAYEYSVPRGAGVWLTRTDTTQPIYLVGEVAEQSTTTTIAGAQGNEPTWNLVAAPTVEAVNLNVKFPNANEGDVVLVPTDGAPKRYTYKNGSWGYDDYVTTVNKRGIEVVKVVRKTDVTNVPIGTGFWYMNAGDAKNVEW